MFWRAKSSRAARVDIDWRITSEERRPGYLYLFTIAQGHLIIQPRVLRFRENENKFCLPGNKSRTCCQQRLFSVDRPITSDREGGANDWWISIGWCGCRSSLRGAPLKGIENNKGKRGRVAFVTLAGWFSPGASSQIRQQLGTRNSTTKGRKACISAYSRVLLCAWPMWLNTDIIIIVKPTWQYLDVETW